MMQPLPEPAASADAVPAGAVPPRRSLRAMLAWLASNIRQVMSVRADNSALLRAQVDALSRLVPLLYFILVANAWVLASASSSPPGPSRSSPMATPMPRPMSTPS